MIHPPPNCNPVPLVPRAPSLKSSKFIGSSLCVYVCVIGNRAGLGGSGMHMWAPALVSDMLGGLDFFERPFSTLNTYQHTHTLSHGGCGWGLETARLWLASNSPVKHHGTPLWPVDAEAKQVKSFQRAEDNLWTWLMITFAKEIGWN